MPRLSFSYRHHTNQIYHFSIPEKYAPGHQLTEGEAQELSKLHMERVRENMRPEVNRQMALADTRSGEPIPETTLISIQMAIENYARAYQFLPRPAKAKLTPLERLARQIAEGQASDDASEEELEALATSQPVLAEARARLATQAELAQAGIEELLR